MFTSGKTLLPDDRTLPVKILKGYHCPWVAHVKVLEHDDGKLVAVSTSGEHNAQCNEAAVLGRIPQELSGRMLAWCLDCLRCGLSIDDILIICHKEDHPQTKMMVAPSHRDQWHPGLHDQASF